MFSYWPWAKAFLVIDHAITLSGIIIFYPIFSHNGLSASPSFPSPSHLLLQIIQCFVIEYSCHQWLPRFPPSTVSEEEQEDLQYGDMKNTSESSGLATEYMVPRLTLFLILVTGEISRGVDFFYGRFHLASVAGWMILRQLRSTCAVPSGESSSDTRLNWHHESEVGQMGRMGAEISFGGKSTHRPP